MTNTDLSIICGVILSIFPYFVLAFIPVWDQLRYSKKTAMVLSSLCMFLNIASVILIIHAFSNWNSFRFYHSVFFLFLYLVIFIAMVRGTPAKLVFLAFLVKSYADFVVSMAKLLEVNYISHIQQSTYIASSYSFYFNLFQCIILLLTYPLFWIFFKYKITHVMKTHNKTWGFLWIIPLVYYIISLAFAAMNPALIAQWQFLVFNLASFFGFLLIYYIVIEMLEQSEKNIILAEKNKVIKQQLELQANYYKKFGECIEETRKSDHDFRHHLSTLLGLVRQHHDEKAEQYLHDLLGNQGGIADILYCQNDAVNALFCYYANICHQDDIELILSAEIPADLTINETDLCVIFGNLLENAVTASQRIQNASKSIEVSSRLIGNRLFITVDNAFDGELMLKDGTYLSQKRKGAPGIGILSVTAIAEKYQGSATFETRQQRFRVSVVLDNRRTPDISPSVVCTADKACDDQGLLN